MTRLPSTVCSCAVILMTVLGVESQGADPQVCPAPGAGISQTSCFKYLVYDFTPGPENAGGAPQARPALDIVGFLKRERAASGPEAPNALFSRSGAFADIAARQWSQEYLDEGKTVLAISAPPSTAETSREAAALIERVAGAQARRIVQIDLEQEEKKIESTLADAADEEQLCSNPEDAFPEDSAWSLFQVNAFEAHKRFSGPSPGSGIVVGHLDTGYSRHPAIFHSAIAPVDGFDFRNCNCDPRDPLSGPKGPMGFYEPGHGTGPASAIIGIPHAALPNGEVVGPGAVQGLAPGVTLLPMRAVRGVIVGPGRAAILAKAILDATASASAVNAAWCDECARAENEPPFHRTHTDRRFRTGRRVDVISMSLGGVLRELGGGDFATRDFKEAYDRSIRLFHDAIREAERRGVIVVAAAGQTGEGSVVRAITKLFKGNFNTAQPASWAETIAAAGTQRNAMPWSASFHGPTVDVCAPARGVWAAKLKGINHEVPVVCTGKGTTYSAALTAGSAALWLDFHRRRGKDLPSIYGGALTSAFRYILAHRGNVPKGQRGYRTRDELCDASSSWQRPPWVPAGPVTTPAPECAMDEDWDDVANGGYGRGILDVDGLLGAPLPSLKAVCLNEQYLDDERRPRDQDRRGRDGRRALFKGKCGNGDCQQCPATAP